MRPGALFIAVVLVLTPTASTESKQVIKSVLGHAGISILGKPSKIHPEVSEDGPAVRHEPRKIGVRISEKRAKPLAVNLQGDQSEFDSDDRSNMHADGQSDSLRNEFTGEVGDGRYVLYFVPKPEVSHGRGGNPRYIARALTEDRLVQRIPVAMHFKDKHNIMFDKRPVSETPMITLGRQHRKNSKREKILSAKKHKRRKYNITVREAGLRKHRTTMKRKTTLDVKVKGHAFLLEHAQPRNEDRREVQATDNTNHVPITDSVGIRPRDIRKDLGRPSGLNNIRSPDAAIELRGYNERVTEEDKLDKRPPLTKEVTSQISKVRSFESIEDILPVSNMRRKLLSMRTNNIVSTRNARTQDNIRSRDMDGPKHTVSQPNYIQELLDFRAFGGFHKPASVEFFSRTGNIKPRDQFRRASNVSSQQEAKQRMKRRTAKIISLRSPTLLQKVVDVNSQATAATRGKGIADADQASILKRGGDAGQKTDIGVGSQPRSDANAESGTGNTDRTFINGHPNLCECIASGHTHYLQFDGQMLHFQGDCTYVLSQTQDQDTPCSFTVHVENRRDQERSVVASSSRTVTVNAMGIEISLMPGRRLKVNGAEVAPPATLASGAMVVSLVGMLIEITMVTCDVRVGFDGVHLVRVQIPHSMGTRVDGLCGNCNDIHDDFRLKNGHDVSTDPEASSLIADNFLVPESSTCRASETSTSCQNETAAQITCSGLTDQSEPFSECSTFLGEITQRLVEQCVMDACEFQSDPVMVERSKCNALGTLGTLCRDHGVLVDWRTPTLCPITCGADATYDAQLTSCPVTCSDVTATGECGRDDAEGCACEDGLVLSGTDCVLPDQCGCTRNGFYYPLGTVLVVRRCTLQLTCARTDGAGQWLKEDLPKCEENAYCSILDGNQECTCRLGYVGDGNVFCSRNSVYAQMYQQLLDDRQTETSICMISGDPHYKTFDGQSLHFQGSCKYTLVETFTSNEECSFKVIARNEHREGRMHVSYTRYLEVHIYGIVVRIKGDVLYVDDMIRHTPFTTADGRLRVTYSTFTQLDTDCGVQLLFDGTTRAVVRIPDTYMNGVNGICGNYNGKFKDDLQLKNGTDVSELPFRFSMIGNSYQLPDDTITQEQIAAGETMSSCLILETSPSCTDSTVRTARGVSRCGFIEKPDGPFATCVLKLGAVETHELLQSCVYDQCAYEHDPEEMDKLLCQDLAAFALDCSQQDVKVDWRSSTFCPLPCPANSHFNPYMVSCQSTCTDRDPSGTCELERREGCECDDGFLLSGTTCVDEDLCGCQGNDGNYVPVGTTFTSNDCSTVFTCTHEPQGAFFASTPASQTCDVNARCTPQNGEMKCTCREGSFGNGFTCTSDTDPVPCTCFAMGDPHYTFYDKAFVNIVSPCKYLMSEADVEGTDCDFRVETKNDFRPGPHIDRAFVELVDIYIGRTVITLKRDRVALVNGAVVSLPLDTGKGVLDIGPSRYLEFTSVCGLTVGFDGIQRVRVAAPAMYSNKMTGLCGNCNGVKMDDLEVSQPHDDVAERNMIIARNNVVVDDTDNQSDDPECTPKP